MTLAYYTVLFIEGVKSFMIPAPDSISLSAFEQGVFLLNVVEPLAAHPTFYKSLNGFNYLPNTLAYYEPEF
jgi:hypothetical protein